MNKISQMLKNNSKEHMKLKNQPLTKILPKRLKIKLNKELKYPSNKSTLIRILGEVGKEYLIEQLKTFSLIFNELKNKVVSQNYMKCKRLRN